MTDPKSPEDEAQQAVAYLRNRRPGVNTTDACSGEWATCWCDDCKKRRWLKASGKPFTNYEVFDLSLDQVRDYIGGAEPEGG